MAERIGRDPEKSVRLHTLSESISSPGTVAGMNARTASWGRVTAGTVALFAVVLAFLAGGVQAGGGPAQAKAPPAPAPLPAAPPPPPPGKQGPGPPPPPPPQPRPPP